jgi:flagella basal body P-ring formation protein FlgA
MMHRLTIAMALLLLLGNVSTSAKAAASEDATVPAVLTIGGDAAIDVDDIRLADLGQVTGGTAVLRRQVKQVTVGRLAVAGQTRRLDPQLVRLRLKQNGLEKSMVRLVMPAPVTVARGTQEVPAAAVQSAVRRELLPRLPWSSATVSVELLTAGMPLRMPSGRLSMEISLPKSRDLLGKVPVSVNFLINERFHKRVWTHATISAFDDVVVTRRPLGRLKPITGEDVVLEPVDLASVRTDFFTDVDDVVGQRMRRSVDAKTILTRTMVEQPPLVRRGDVVLIVAESSGLRITTMGEVRQKGREGDRVKVLNLASQKTLYARVLDGRTVAVDF